MSEYFTILHSFIDSLLENWPSFDDVILTLEENIVAIIDWCSLAVLVFIFTRFMKYMGGWRRGK